jgi:ACS family hexuronate transporter-like MFS transporter
VVKSFPFRDCGPWVTRVSYGAVTVNAPSATATTTIKIRRLRWYIAGLLFLATTINYVDRQVFSILAPDLQQRIGWSELDYGRIVIAFQLSYAVMLVVSGRILDRVGTKLGFALAIVAWSLAEVGHAFARSAFGFGVARFVLGVGEAANFPAAVKTVAAWFPASERALATGIFNSGVALGAVIAPIVVPVMAAAWGWQSAFVTTGVLGLLWLAAWWVLYDEPAVHPRLTDEERTFISGGVVRDARARVALSDLLRLRETWAYAIPKALADPIWWFYLFWLPKFLAQEHGIRGTAVIPYLTTVYIAADIGPVAAGYVSSAMVQRGWTVNRSRKTTLTILAGIMMPAVILASQSREVWPAMLLIALACGCHQAWSTLLFTVPSDLFPSHAAGSVTGIGGCVAGFVSIGTAELTGQVLNRDPSLYVPMFLTAAALYPLGLAVFHVLSPKMTPARM